MPTLAQNNTISLSEQHTLCYGSFDTQEIWLCFKTLKSSDDERNLTHKIILTRIEARHELGRNLISTIRKKLDLLNAR